MFRILDYDSTLTFDKEAAETPAIAMRGFGDAPSARKAIFDGVLTAARTLPALGNKRHSLTLSDVDYDDDEDIPLSAQKQAILSNSTLDRRLRGTWNLTDNVTGQLVDQRKMTVARVPYLTNRGTFIHNGTEYTLNNQMRLRPGIFTRVKENGEIEAHVNVRPGQGASHRYFLDPVKNTFHARLGQAKIPLMPLLRALGATDKNLQDAWGPEITAANYNKDTPADFNKLYQRLVRKADMTADAPTRRAALKSALEKMELDPEVTTRTLGKSYKSLNLEAILDTTKKLIGIQRGEQEVDDRDHLAYQTVFSAEDLFAERLTRDAGGLRRKLLNRASMRNSLQSMVPNALGRQLEAALLQSGLGQSIEETNPADVFDKSSRITRLGEGGIPSLDSVPDEARAVQPSHLGFLDPLRTPESLRVGVDIHLASQAKKGADGRLYSPFVDTKTGKIVYRSPQDVADLAIAFPGEMEKGTKRVAAMQKGRIRFVPRDQVALVPQHFENAFSPLANLVPMKSGSKGQRVMMASRMLTQALPLSKPESPLVQGAMPGRPDRSFEEEYGSAMGAVRASKPGRVMAVSPDGIDVRHADGTKQTYQTYNNFPYNRKTFIHNTPTVQPGDDVQSGGLLARSNYTDDQGTTALGLNARVGYMSYKGYNFEDATVISEGMAKRLSSEHMYQQGVDWSKDHKRGKKSYLSLFPSRYDRKTLESMDDDGVIKTGSMVEYDTPLVLAAQQRTHARNRIYKKGESGFSDGTITWRHQSPGIVTDVHKGKKHTAVVVKSLSSMQVGDKLVNRYGGKGIVASIVPDDQMPKAADGKPLEVLLNPLGVISRGNPSQVVETILGKIAAITGKPYKVQDFENNTDLAEFAIKELERHGLKDKEDLTDPETGRKIPGVLTGSQYFLKLHHTAESKGQGRSTGGYTQLGEPARGGESGSKRLSLMDQNALMSHGATNVMRDAAAIRGQRNEEFWLPFLQGHTPPKPKVPFVYEKFVNELKGSGINVVPKGGQVHIMAMTDHDIDNLSGDREITSGETVKFEKGLLPITGGLFDPKLTGGHHGGRWAHIKLHEPMPNPVMEEPIRRLLGLTQKNFEDVMSGAMKLDTGTGPRAIQAALSKISLPRELALARMQIQSGRKTARDLAIRKLGYLRSAQELGIHPRDWMLTKVPVLPPTFRAVSVMSDSKLPLVADANYLYKDLIEANNNLKDMSSAAEDVGEERLALYNSFKAVTGLGDPIHPKNQQRGVKGLLKHIFGTSPKLGHFQRRLLSSSVDLVGRAAISPDPDLDMDHVGLPETRAWDVYKPFIIRRLRRLGASSMDALRHVEDRTATARQELLSEMEHRPVIINRAPVLHKFGIQAFIPVLTKGDTLKVSPLIVGGFNADFDGDAMQYHVPVDDDARKDALERMLPSRNLFSPSDFKSPVAKPTQEYVGGLYSASAPPRKKGRAHYFTDKKSAIAAYWRGDIPVDAEVVIR